MHLKKGWIFWIFDAGRKFGKFFVPIFLIQNLEFFSKF